MRTPIAAAALSAVLTVVTAPRQAPATPQDQTVFRAGTTLVPVDVRVVDKNGHPVTDLHQSDFTILEDGVPQRIEHFSTQAFAAEPPTASAPSSSPARPRRASSAFELTSQNLRTFLIVLGRGRLQPPADGVEAMRHLIKARLLPQDQVAVQAWNRATDFSTDRKTALEVLDRFQKANDLIEVQIQQWERNLQHLSNPKVLPAFVQQEIDDVFGGPRASRTVGDRPAAAAGLEDQTVRVMRDALTGGTLDPVDQMMLNLAGGDLDGFLNQQSQVAQDVTALYTGVAYLQQLAGEKHLIFLSEYGVSLPHLEDDRDLGRLAADARVVLDVIHSGGVGYKNPRGADYSPTMMMPANRGPSSLYVIPSIGTQLFAADTARNLTRMTGGLFFANRFAKASMDVDAIDATTRFEYVLGYYPLKATLDGRYRKITVKLNRPGLTVLARDGYLARAEVAPADRTHAIISSRVVGAAGFDRPIPDIAIKIDRASASMSGRTGQALIDMTIDVSRVFFEKTEGRQRGSIEVAVFCVAKGDQGIGHSWQTLELNYSDARLAEVKGRGVTHSVTIPLTGQPQAAKVVVYDYGSDLVGTVVTQLKR